MASVSMVEAVSADRPLKLLLAMLCGLLTTFLVAGVIMLATMATGFLVTSVSIFFVPIGALIAGAGAGFGLSRTMQALHQKPSGVMWVNAAGLGLLCWFSIYYGLYSRTYLDDDYRINYRGNGQHISEFVDAGTGEAITFRRYLINEVRSRQISLAGGGGAYHTYNARNSVATAYKWFTFGLEGVGLTLGSMFAMLRLQGLVYCERCGRFMRRRRLFGVPLAAFPPVWAALEPATRSAAHLAAFAAPRTTVNEKEPHVMVELDRCEHCHYGQLMIRMMTSKMSKRYWEDPARRQTIALPPEVAAAAAGLQVRGAAKQRV